MFPSDFSSPKRERGPPSLTLRVGDGQEPIVPDFTYEAINATGQRATGTLSAVSEREVMAMLDAKSLFPVRVVVIRGTETASHSNRQVKPRQMSAFYSQLADLP